MDVIQQFIYENNPEVVFQDTEENLNALYNSFIKESHGTLQNSNFNNITNYFAHITSRLTIDLIKAHREKFSALTRPVKEPNANDEPWTILDIYDTHPESDKYKLTIEFEAQQTLIRPEQNLYLFKINFGKNTIYFVSSLLPKENDIFSNNTISKSLFNFQKRTDCKAKFVQLLQAFTFQWVSKEAKRCLNVFPEEEANKLENLYIYKDPYVNAKNELERMLAADCYGNVYRICSEKSSDMQSNCNYKIRPPKLTIAITEFINLEKYKNTLTHVKSLNDQKCFKLILNPKETFPFSNTSIWRHLSNLFQTETCNFLSEEQYSILCKCIAPGNEGSMVSYVRTNSGSGSKRIIRMLISAFYSYQFSINKFYKFNNDIPRILVLTHNEHYANAVIEDILDYQLLINSGSLYLPEYLKVTNTSDITKPYNIGSQVNSFLERFDDEDLNELMKDLEKDKQQIEIDLKYLEVELEKAKQSSKIEVKENIEQYSNEMKEIKNKYFSNDHNDKKACLEDSYVNYLSFCILYLQEELNKKETDILRFRTIKTFDEQSARNFCLKNFLINSPIVFTSEESLRDKSCYKLLEGHTFDYLIITEVDKVEEINFLRFINHRTKKVVFIENNYDIHALINSYNKCSPKGFINRLTRNGMPSLDIEANLQQSEQLKNLNNYVLGNEIVPKLFKKPKKRVGLGLDLDDDLFNSSKKVKIRTQKDDFGISDDLDIWHINILEYEKVDFIRDSFYIFKRKLEEKLEQNKEIKKVGLVVDGNRYINAFKEKIEEFSDINIEVLELGCLSGKTFDLTCFLFDKRHEDMFFVKPENFLYLLASAKTCFWVISYDYSDLGTSANRYIDQMKTYLKQINALKNIEYVGDYEYKTVEEKTDTLVNKPGFQLDLI